MVYLFVILRLHLRFCGTFSAQQKHPAGSVPEALQRVEIISRKNSEIVLLYI